MVIFSPLETPSGFLFCVVDCSRCRLSIVSKQCFTPVIFYFVSCLLSKWSLKRGAYIITIGPISSVFSLLLSCNNFCVYILLLHSYLCYFIPAYQALFLVMRCCKCYCVGPTYKRVSETWYTWRYVVDGVWHWIFYDYHDNNDINTA